MGRRPISWWPKPFIPKDICGISPGFPGLFPAKRYVIYVLLTRSPLEPKFALDLHVLSPPLAFALSQDQTLTLKRLIWPITYILRRSLTSTKHPDASQRQNTRR